jgi:hypothetical protein
MYFYSDIIYFLFLKSAYSYILQGLWPPTPSFLQYTSLALSIRIFISAQLTYSLLSQYHPFCPSDLGVIFFVWLSAAPKYRLYYKIHPLFHSKHAIFLLRK